MSCSTAQQIINLKDTIQALETQRSALGYAVVDVSISALLRQIAELEAQAEPIQQHKLVTILFMDVVGSTASISTRLDPLDTLEIMYQSLRRLAKPIEIAQAVLYLASEAASYVTGTTLVVDGGGLA